MKSYKNIYYEEANKKLDLSKIKLYTMIADSSSTDDVIKLFIDYLPLLINVDIIFVDDKSEDVCKIVKEFFDIKKGVLDSPFYKDNLFLLNIKTVIESKFKASSKIKYFFDIHLDTQIVSYINSYYYKKNVADDIFDLVRNINKKRNFASTITINPYLIENTLFSDYLTDIQKNNIMNFFKHLNYSHTKFKFLANYKTKKNVDKIINFYESKKNKQAFKILIIYFNLSYIMLLKIIIIENSISNPLENKLKALIQFCNNELGSMLLAEINIAIEYFKRGQNLRFFSKVYKGNKNIISIIKNMAWDVFHARHLEYIMGNINFRNEDVTLPLLLSVDKRFNEIKKLIKLKMMIIEKDSNNYYPFYENNEIKNILSHNSFIDLFSVENAKKRINVSKNTNLDDLIKKLEHKVVELLYN